MLFAIRFTDPSGDVGAVNFLSQGGRPFLTFNSPIARSADAINFTIYTVNWQPTEHTSDEQST